MPLASPRRPRRPLTRPLPIAAASAALLVALTGCAGGGSKPTASTAAPAASTAQSSAPLACVDSGTASDSVKVTGGRGAAPTVAFPKPITASATEKTVVTAGSGPKVTRGSSIRMAYTLYEGKTGKKLDTAGYGGKKPVVVTVDPAQYLPGLMEAVDCAQEGSRIAAVIPPARAFGATGNPQLGVGKGDSVVFVVDVVSITPTKANGAVKALPSGFPTVSVAADGTPTVRIPKAKQPTGLRIAEREAGTGETVKSGDTVTVQYQGLLWRTGAVFDQSWGKSGPASFATGAVVKGFGKALIGHRVGSQVVALVPPAEGYGSKGSPQAGIKGSDVMVFVVDILATTHA